MTSRRTVSERGLAFIEAHEGFRPRASRLPDGRWLLGYSSIEDDAEGREITLEQAEQRLREELAPIEELVGELVFAPLAQGQFDALVSLAFSIGPEAFRSCGVAEALNEGRPIDAAAVFDQWQDARVGGVVRRLDALVRRRAAEKAMFLALEDGPVPAPSALLRSAEPRIRGSDAPSRRRPHASVQRPIAPADPQPAMAQWPWLVSGAGLGLAVVAAANVRAAAEAAPVGDASWVVAMVAGVLTLGAGAYYAARRLGALRAPAHPLG